MKFIESTHIDKEVWSDLTINHSTHFFSETNYLDAVAENWGAYVKGNYEAVLVIPYRVKFGLKWVYLPLFYRSSEWVGNWTEEEKEEIKSRLLKDFNGGNIAFEESNVDTSDFFYQVIHPNQEHRTNYNKLATRMLKKAQHSELKQTNELHLDVFVKLIAKELQAKVGVWDEEGIAVFKNLVNNYAKDDKLKFYGAILHGELVGGIVTLISNNRILYLKGTATIEAKKMGAIYMVMDAAIHDAMQKKCTFDFGGSRVDGVARFNYNLGGTDVHYQNMVWDNFPFWFRLMKRLKNRWM